MGVIVLIVVRKLNFRTVLLTDCPIEDKNVLKCYSFVSQVTHFPMFFKLLTASWYITFLLLLVQSRRVVVRWYNTNSISWLELGFTK